MTEEGNMKEKLDIQHKHILRLVHRDADANGWASVSNVLFPILSENMPPELVEFERTDDGGRARLTPDGEAIVMAMSWL